MSGSENPLRVLHCADIHLGHQKVKTIDTANNIRKYLFPKLANVDLISIAGDIFHGRIALDSPDSNIVIDLFVDLLVKCYENDVTLRVLNGTFSHDLHQNDLITQLYKKLGLPVNYKLYKVLDIEYIQHLNIHILYVPDNLPFRHKHEILTRINDLLISHGIKQVDYVMLHGEFDNTLYGKYMHNAFNLSDFNGICRNRILAGHVHSPQQHGKLLYAGSFNRLAHGEEEPKGFWIVEGSEANFIENQEAVKFITLDYTSEDDLTTMLERHQKRMLNLPTAAESHVRVILSDPHLKQALRSYHLGNFPTVKLTFKSKVVDKHSDQYLDEKLKSKLEEHLEAPSLKNLPNLIYKHMTDQSIIINLESITRILAEA